MLKDMAEDRHLKDLWTDVIRSTHGCGAIDFPIGIHLEARAKVSQSDVTILVNENVVWFDVPVQEQQASKQLAKGSGTTHPHTHGFTHTMHVLYLHYHKQNTNTFHVLVL